ncbi:hypothetical protein [Rodentibacter pneumotropicus]|uniref:hypothetical protein n=1 Tax=Rodentibacter pneumotropicus TaxID=758 RepID=UPI00267683D6|nr:hypothetical protein [Rodentibacter pneumotropicus]
MCLEKLIRKEINSIFEKLKIANHYLQEWEVINLLNNEDNGKIYKQHYFSLAFIKKSYIEYCLVILNTIFSNDGVGNLPTLRKKSEYFLGKRLSRLDEIFPDFNRIKDGLKIIRDKTIEHTEDYDINIFYKKAKISKKDIDELIRNILDFLNYILNESNINLGKDLLLNYNNEIGIKIIYNKLKESDPQIALEKELDKIQEEINKLDRVCEP